MDAKLDAKRLEELAAWATAQEQSLVANEITDVAEYFRDLSRCAAAWAKVERTERPYIERRDWPQGTRWYFWGARIDAVSGNTAIEAIEAAPEVKP